MASVTSCSNEMQNGRVEKQHTAIKLITKNLQVCLCIICMANFQISYSFIGLVSRSVISAQGDVNMQPYF